MSRLKRTIEKITKKGAKIKNFKAVLRDYHKKIKEAAKPNINQQRVERKYQSVKNVKQPYDKARSVHNGRAGVQGRLYYDDMFIGGSWRLAVQITAPAGASQLEMKKVWETVMETFDN